MTNLISNAIANSRTSKAEKQECDALSSHCIEHEKLRVEPALICTTQKHCKYKTEAVVLVENEVNEADGECGVNDETNVLSHPTIQQEINWQSIAGYFFTYFGVNALREMQQQSPRFDLMASWDVTPHEYYRQIAIAIEHIKRD